MADFEALDVQIIGVSFDAPEANATFRENQGFPFELWSDVDHTLAIAYKAARSESDRIARRNTAILDSEGELVWLCKGVANVLGHPHEVLETCQELFGS